MATKKKATTRSSLRGEGASSSALKKSLVVRPKLVEPDPGPIAVDWREAAIERIVLRLRNIHGEWPERLVQHSLIGEDGMSDPRHYGDGSPVIDLRISIAESVRSLLGEVESFCVDHEVNATHAEIEWWASVAARDYLVRVARLIHHAHRWQILNSACTPVVKSSRFKKTSNGIDAAHVREWLRFDFTREIEEATAALTMKRGARPESERDHLAWCARSRALDKLRQAGGSQLSAQKAGKAAAIAIIGAKSERGYQKAMRKGKDHHAQSANAHLPFCP